jgi:hypothetical protein
MLAEAVKDLFIKSDPRTSSSGTSLGVWAENILLHITGQLENDPEV